MHYVHSSFRPIFFTATTTTTPYTLSLHDALPIYGLGILFATQAPKSVDQQLIASCATHLYGRVSSPAAIETVREQIRRRGGRSEEYTSELQSQSNLVCRLLLEKKNSR